MPVSTIQKLLPIFSECLFTLTQEVLYADVGPFTKVTNQLATRTLLMEDQKVEYSEIVHQRESVFPTAEVPQHSDIGKTYIATYINIMHARMKSIFFIYTQINT